MPMPMVVPETEDEILAFKQWYFRKKGEIERGQRVLEDEKKRFEMQRAKLDRERRDFSRQKEADARVRDQEEYVLKMKQQVLEDELKKLANEKRYLERQKEFYDKVKEFQLKQDLTSPGKRTVVKGELFFIGVHNEIALKKRYKDLIKIYHPDNVCGDTDTLQEINREYDKLRTEFTAC